MVVLAVVIWDEIAKQGFNILVISIFAYVCYTYFTNQRTVDWARFDKQLAEKDRIIAEKDAQLRELSERVLDFTKLAVETNSNVIIALNRLTAKLDKLT